MKTSMKYIIGILVLLAALYGGYAYGVRRALHLDQNSSATPANATDKDAAAPTVLISPEPSPTPAKPAAAPSMPKTSTAPKMQFTKCKAEPDSLTVKRGASFRFENFDATSRKISVDTQTFNIQPNYFAIAVAEPLGTHMILCDGAGVGTLNVIP